MDTGKTFLLVLFISVVRTGENLIFLETVSLGYFLFRREGSPEFYFHTIRHGCNSSHTSSIGITSISISSTSSSSRLVKRYCLLVSSTTLSPSPGSFNLTQIVIAMALVICCLDNLHVHILLEISVSMLFALQVISIEVVVVVVNAAVVVVLAMTSIISSTFYLYDKWSWLWCQITP